MRRFEYFLFENFDPDEHRDDPNNPRSILGENCDPLLTAVSLGAALEGQCRDSFGSSLVDQLIHCGVLRQEDGFLFFDCPVFLREDAPVLKEAITREAGILSDRLAPGIWEIRQCCASIQNGFSVDQNLYHILCGMVFDGSFFDYLCRQKAVATSRKHPGGLDYLAVLYENCEQLRSLSNDRLCSYNRLADGKTSLQSFGDAQGDRFDFYRFFRLLEQGKHPEKFQHARSLLDAAGGADKGVLLSQAASFVRTGHCSSPVMGLLEEFGYAKNGVSCVPVYTFEHRKTIEQIGFFTEQILGEAVVQSLTWLSAALDITAVRNQVDPLEISNELYHLLFGSINEALVQRGFVSAPPFFPGEGRYAKCIVLD